MKRTSKQRRNRVAAEEVDEVVSVVAADKDNPSRRTRAVAVAMRSPRAVKARDVGVHPHKDGAHPAVAAAPKGCVLEFGKLTKLAEFRVALGE